MDKDKSQTSSLDDYKKKIEDARRGIYSRPNNSAPIIHTLESDTHEMLETQKLDSVQIASKQFVENDLSGVTASVAVQDNNRASSYNFMMYAIMSILVFTIGTASYFYIFKKDPVVEAVIIPVKIYTVADVWPEARERLETNTGAATSTENHVVININNFDNVYAYLIQNEAIFNTIAKNKFNMETLSEFGDVNVKNNDVRIADGGIGPLVYGYVGQKYLIIANSVDEWIKTKESISTAVPAVVN